MSAVDVSMLTGEPVPVEIGAGDEVFGAIVNTSGRVVVEATRVGSDTALAQVVRLVEEAQGSKAPVQHLADRISAVFVPIVVAIALATAGFWLVAGQDPSEAFTAAVAVLIIACPCALGLATPTAIMVGTGRGAQLGIVINGGEVLEATQRIERVVVDKTGTITDGRMELVDVVVAPGVSLDDALRLAGSAEDASEHPIASRDRPRCRGARCPDRRADAVRRTTRVRECARRSTTTRSSSDARRCSNRWRTRCAPRSTPPKRPATPQSSRLGRRTACGVRGRRHREANLARGDFGLPRARARSRHGDG